LSNTVNYPVSLFGYSPKSFQYDTTLLSPEVQNRMIDCATTVLLREVTAPVHNSGPFSIIADGTVGLVIFHAVNRCRWRCARRMVVISMRFVGYAPIKEQNAEAMATAVKNKSSAVAVQRWVTVAIVDMG